ncbi:hypothetical protein G9A89_007149 [Geosiphon pyriformis]|nr:hypothetical protein G9A89_007149 [Geosiphon pyriformis]
MSDYLKTSLTITRQAFQLAGIGAGEVIVDILKDILEAKEKIKQNKKNCKRLIKVTTKITELKEDLDEAVDRLTLNVVLQIGEDQKEMNRKMIQMIAIHDDAPLDDQILNEITISDAHIADDPKEQFARRLLGSRSHVVKRYYAEENVPVAEKQIAKRVADQEKDFLKEIALWRLLNNVTGILRLYIITEWAKNGDLEKYLADPNNTLTWIEKVKIGGQIANALYFCHVQDVLHHDVRSHNILLDEDLNAKLTNFENSRKETDDSKSISDTFTEARWTAPEKLADSKTRYSKACDAYSFAIVLWELATQQIPYGNIERPYLIGKILDGERPNSDIPNMPPQYKELMIQGWSSNYWKRPKMSYAFCNLERLFKEMQIQNTKISTSDISLDQISTNFLLSLYNPDEESDSPIPNIATAICHYKAEKFKEAWEIFKYFLEQGNVTAKFYAGYYFFEGKDPVPKNKRRALELWRQAADCGDRDSQYQFSLTCMTLQTTREQKELASKYFKMALKKDHPGALYNYGLDLFKKKKFTESEKYLKRASEMGHKNALSKLDELKRQHDF